MSIEKDGRSRRTVETRRRLVDAAIQQVVEGREPTMRSVARAAGVAERTIYRHFDGIEALEAAVRAAVAPRLGAPLPEVCADLPAYAEELFARFEANLELLEPVVLQGQARLAAPRRRNLEALQALLRQDYPKADPDALAAGAAALRALLSGAGWYYLRMSCGLPQEAVVAAAKRAIAVHLADLGRA